MKSNQSQGSAKKGFVLVVAMVAHCYTRATRSHPSSSLINMPYLFVVLCLSNSFFFSALSFTACPVNFEFMNYTIITSQCKGPRYPAELCCAALVKFACPYADEINDGTNDCASTMFSYINLYGKYPPGLFASECKGDKQGLICPADSPGGSKDVDASAAHVTGAISPRIALISILVLGFLFS